MRKNGISRSARLDEDIIDLRDLARALVRGLACILAAAVLCGLLGFGYGRWMVTPVYRSGFSALIYNHENSEGFDTTSAQDFSASMGLVPVYGELAVSQPNLEAAAALAGVPCTAAELAGKITVTVDADALLLRAEVSDPDPQAARQIAEALAEATRTRGAELVRGSSMVIMEPPVAADSPSSPGWKHYTLAGILAGGGLAALVVLLSAVLDDRLRGVEELEDLRQRVLCRLPRAKKGAHPVVRFRSTRPTGIFAGADRSFLLQALEETMDQDCLMIGVADCARGSAGAAIAAGLAMASADAGKRTLLIHFDYHQSLHRSGLPGILNCLEGSAAISNAVRDTGDDMPDVLGVGFAQAGFAPSPGKVRELLEVLRFQYDRIFLHLPPMLEGSDGACLAAVLSGTVLVVQEGRTKRRWVRESLRRMFAAGAWLPGFVYTEDRRVVRPEEERA